MPKAWINVSKTGYMQEIYKKPHSIAHDSFSHMDKRGMAFYQGGGGGGVDCCVLVFNVTRGRVGW